MTAPRATSRFGLTAAVVVLFLATAGVVVGRGSDSTIPVTVQGRRLTLSARRHRVADALKEAHVVVHDGVLYSVTTHRVLDAHAAPAVITADGRPVSLPTQLTRGAEIQVVNGMDAVEPVDVRRVPSTPTGLPPVERRLYRPGHPGIDDIEVGRVSGEVVSRVVIVSAGTAVTETRPVVALTFDDGPNPQATPLILQILRDENVTATFCIYGQKATVHPELLRAVAVAGHTLCDHTMHHMLDLPKRPHTQIVAEVYQCADLIRSVTGEDPLLYRAPGGAVSPDVIDVAHQRGLRVLGWSVDPHDYQRPPPMVIIQRVLAGVRPGAVILLHDGGGDRSNTVAALRPLIDQLRAMGYSFTTPASP